MGNTQQNTVDPPGGMQIEGVPSGGTSDVKSEIKMTIKEARRQVDLREAAENNDRNARDREFEQNSRLVIQTWLALFIDALHKEAPKHTHTIGLTIAAKKEYYSFNMTIDIPDDLTKQTQQLGCGSLHNFVNHRCKIHSHGESGSKMRKKMHKEAENIFGVETYCWDRDDVDTNRSKTIVIGIQLALNKSPKIECCC